MMTQDGETMVGAGFLTPAPWDSLIERCKVLARRYSSAKEILDFYHKILTFQKGLYEEVRGNKEVFAIEEVGARCNVPLLKKGLEVLFPHSPTLLSIVREGPPLLAVMSREVSSWGLMGWETTLEDYRYATHR